MQDLKCNCGGTMKHNGMVLGSCLEEYVYVCNNCNQSNRLADKDIKDILDKELSPIMKYFAYDHLPEKLQNISKPIGDLAQKLDESLPNCAEKSAGLRKLLEAKDCFVRAALEK